MVDLSGGPEAESWPVWTLEGAPPDGWGDAYKTDRLLLRRVEPGTFAMGSPSGELGRATDETRHEVALEEGYWLGVFEVTQRQWELATGGKPSAWAGAAHPAEVKNQLQYSQTACCMPICPADNCWQRSVFIF